ncbi:hypothetical protein TNCV_377941 [Trichonephila clavipes]|nr:hypothetical protein TNCV_377941 [Trichonephila clavipes]
MKARRESLCLVNLDFLLKRTCPHSCGALMFSAPQISCLSYWMHSKGHTRLGAKLKRQSLQDGCRAFAWKFFQTQQQGHEQAEKSLFTYVVVRFKPNTDLEQILLLCGDLR